MPRSIAPNVNSSAVIDFLLMQDYFYNQSAQMIQRNTGFNTPRMPGIANAYQQLSADPASNWQSIARLQLLER